MIDTPPLLAAKIISDFLIRRLNRHLQLVSRRSEIRRFQIEGIQLDGLFLLRGRAELSALVFSIQTGLKIGKVEEMHTASTTGKSGVNVGEK
jgi:hypothetical protein